MKRYGICFLFLSMVILCCLLVGFVCAARKERQEEPVTIVRQAGVQELSRFMMERKVSELHRKQEDMDPEAVQVNQGEAAAEQGEYYLVEENGFLMVFGKDKTTLSLHTHMPITDFPSSEQERLAEGIWFSSMLDIFNYLESYTS